MVVGLLTVGVFAHSLGVLAAGGDYIADAGAIAVSLLAFRISGKPSVHPKVTSYAALINVTLMLFVTIFVAYSSIQRLATTVPHIIGVPVVIVSVIGTVVMAFCAYLLAAGKENDLSMRAVLLDTTADAAFSDWSGCSWSYCYYYR